METLLALIDSLRTALAARPANDASLTIGDVYLRLIPYRLVRAEFGVLEFAAYEHALLRLFSGEGEYVRVNDERAREEIQRELASVNPILGIYRDYADARIEVADDAGAPIVLPSEAGIPDTDAAPPEPTPTISSTSSCPHCGQSLPSLPEIRFCPFCGESPQPIPCRECGTPLEGEWSFCIRCGTHR